MHPRRPLFLNWVCVLIVAYGDFTRDHTRRSANAAATTLKTRAVVLIVLDGFRWQEVFERRRTRSDGRKTRQRARHHATPQRFLARNAGSRPRKRCMPFLWTVVAKQGQIYGNQHKGSVAQVTNGFKFSYPGYNEMSTGYPNPQINSNEFGANPNATVFEWLNNQPEFHNQVAIFGTWDTFNDIFRAKQSGLLVRAGLESSVDANS